MTVTILALLLLVSFLLVAVVGIRLIQKKTREQSGNRLERCAICRRPFDPSAMIMREVGDYRLLWFCRECVKKLAEDLSGGHGEE